MSGLGRKRNHQNRESEFSKLTKLADYCSKSNRKHEEVSGIASHLNLTTQGCCILPA